MNSGKATYCCNPEMLKYYRELLGLTQDELAQKAGYTRRLITKAEAGKSISAETARDLATALSTAEHSLKMEDLISDPIAMARQVVASFYIAQKEALQHIGHLVTEQTLFWMHGDPSQIPFAGKYVGPEGLHELMQKFYAVLEVPEGHDHTKCYQFYGQGNEVVIWGESWIHPIGHPMQEPIKVTHLMRFEQGKLLYFEDRYDEKMGIENLNKLKQEPDEKST